MINRLGFEGSVEKLKSILLCPPRNFILPVSLEFQLKSPSITVSQMCLRCS